MPPGRGSHMAFRTHGKAGKHLRLGVLASGGGTNLQSILDRIGEGALDADVVAVISNNSRAKALDRARALGIPALHVSAATEGSFDAADERIEAEFLSRGADLIVLAGYMKKVGPALLGAFRGRIINIHPALLPQFGGDGMYGMRVHEAVIAARARESGPTVHVVDDRYDHGAILAQRKVEVLPGDTPETLQRRVLEVEHEILPDTIRKLGETWEDYLLDRKREGLTADLIRRELDEDIGAGDITTDAIVAPELVSTAFLFSKAKGILAGMDVAADVFRAVDSSLTVRAFYRDGDLLNEGRKVADITGPVGSILRAERTALNFLGRMSGIATKTRQYVALVEGLPVRIIDTRKTAPGMRHLDKYAVKTGGGANHRFGLHDMVLIKDNHIAVSGGIRIAVEHAVDHVRRMGRCVKIEVECKSFDEVLEAMYTPADVIMLDNMDAGEIRKSVVEARKISSETGRKVLLEASGNVCLKNVREIAETGIDVISVGALTHSVVCHDFSLLFVEL
jgi:nicotinate-nucleotide pyrophosphorylase (carboxylating)